MNGRRKNFQGGWKQGKFHLVVGASNLTVGLDIGGIAPTVERDCMLKPSLKNPLDENLLVNNPCGN